MTEVVIDDVSHTGSQQESRRGTSTVPVPPPRAQAARRKGGMGQEALMGQEAPMGPGVTAHWKNFVVVFTLVGLAQ